jgi:CRISPR-associated protein Cmr5
MTTERCLSLVAARARYAYDDVANWSEKWSKEANKRVKGLPVQVRTQGLMVSIAMLMSEDTHQSRKLAALLADWLLRQAPVQVLPWTGHAGSRPTERELLDACSKGAHIPMLAAQREAIAILEQVKLYAQALWA